MRNDRNLVEQVVNRAFEDEGTSATVSRPAAVAEMARTYVPVPREGGGDNSDRLLGFLLNLSYDDVTIVTCDAWKRKCGGVPRNTLVMLRLAPARVSKEDAAYADRLIVVRINDSVPTPVDSEQKAVIFQIHKAQANVDPITGNELTWSALKGKIIGVFYDDHGPDGNGEARVGFNRAVDTFFSPHFYEVYVPRIDHLDVLVNAFSEDPNPLEIGVLRYVETPPVRRRNEVAVKVNPTDFSGKSYGHRTGLFGKTRFGKSNTMKVIADTILERGEDGQIIFDPSTEYTYWNEQDQGCLAARHPERCVRYSLDPQPREGDRKVGLPLPKALQIDFFGNAEVGKSLIFNLWASENGRVPDYIVPAQNWEPAPISEAPSFNEDQSGYNRYWRTMGIWWAILYEAGFTPPTQHTVPLDFRKDVKEHLRDLVPAAFDAAGEFRRRLPISTSSQVWKRVAELHEGMKAGSAEYLKHFPASSSSGDPYFDTITRGLLRILEGSTGSGPQKFSRFKKYHAPGGANVFDDVVDAAKDGKTVFLDLALGDEQVVKVVAERISRTLLNRQMRDFSKNAMGPRKVVLYFEEAHVHFPKDDKDIGGNVYNELAKQGAKFNISLVYATQSISTLSPDLMKMTENFIIAHLDDDREVRELKHKEAFRDIADDVERITGKGYVLFKSLSLPFALQVQIRRFDGSPRNSGRPAAAPAEDLFGG